MASFSAQLRVAGHVFSVLHCSCHTSQATNERGRVSTKVRHHPVELVLDVPDLDVLLAWAAAPHKRQAADIVFLDGASRNALETVHMAGAYCVSYRENFASGDTSTGAYQCHITLSDPDGFTLLPGGPVGKFTVPPAGNHGVPAPASIAATPVRNAGARATSSSTCPESVRVPLQNNVNNRCKGEHKCRGGDDCPNIEKNIETITECMNARIKIMEKCYKGGDLNHKTQVLNKLNALITCQELYSKKCNKGQQPEPVPVPRRTPSEDPGKLPTLPKEAPLAAVGLFILYLITGALRPGPI